MDELAISPEELATIIGPDPISPPLQKLSPSASTQPAPAAAANPVALPPAVEPPMSSQPSVTVRPAQFAPLQSTTGGTSATNIDMLLGVNMRVTVELGRTRMSIEEVLRLGPGSVIELDKLAGEPVDVLVNERLIAHGEVVVLDDRFGVRITDVLPPVQRISSI
jgi:flagellar motor switch protein FliN/FliY